MSGFDNYDAWKTACCDRWPNCKNCGEEEQDYDDMEDYDRYDDDY